MHFIIIHIDKKSLPKKDFRPVFYGCEECTLCVAIHAIMTWMSWRGTRGGKLFARASGEMKGNILMQKGQHFLHYVKFHYRADSHLLDLMHPNCSNYDFILKQTFFFKTMIIATHNHFMSKRSDCKGNNSVLPQRRYKRTKYILIVFLPFGMD